MRLTNALSLQGRDLVGSGTIKNAVCRRANARAKHGNLKSVAAISEPPVPSGAPWRRARARSRSCAIHGAA